MSMFFEIEDLEGLVQPVRSRLSELLTEHCIGKLALMSQRDLLFEHAVTKRQAVIDKGALSLFKAAETRFLCRIPNALFAVELLARIEESLLPVPRMGSFPFLTLSPPDFASVDRLLSYCFDFVKTELEVEIHEDWLLYEADNLPLRLESKDDAYVIRGRVDNNVCGLMNLFHEFGHFLCDCRSGGGGATYVYSEIIAFLIEMLLLRRLLLKRWDHQLLNEAERYFGLVDSTLIILAVEECKFVRTGTFSEDSLFGPEAALFSPALCHSSAMSVVNGYAAMARRELFHDQIDLNSFEDVVKWSMEWVTKA